MKIINQAANYYLKELTLLFRNKGTYGGVLLFLISSVLIVYHIAGASNNIETFNAIIWIILLFSVTTSVTANFGNENDSINIYNYSIISPLAYIFSKIMFNVFISIVLALLTKALFYLFFNFMPEKLLLYLIALLSGVIGFSLIITFTSAISVRAGGNFTLTAILSFPLIFPVIITANKLTIQSLTVSGIFEINVLLQSLLLNFLIFLLIIVLFPYLWKE